MKATEIQICATQLLERHGSKAIAQAAQKAVKFERSGDMQQAKTWRRIEAALMLVRGPRES